MPTPPTHIVTLLFRDEAEARLHLEALRAYSDWTSMFLLLRDRAEHALVWDLSRGPEISEVADQRHPLDVHPIRVWSIDDDGTFPAGVQFQGAFSVA